MTGAVLSVKELKSLSRTGQKKPMVNWLHTNNYPFDVGADGWPVVLWSYVDARLGSNTKIEKKQPRLILQ